MGRCGKSKRSGYKTACIKEGENEAENIFTKFGERFMSLGNHDGEKWFCILLWLTLMFTLRGFDDIPYKYKEKIPPYEAVRHVSFTMSKLFAFMMGGAIISKKMYLYIEQHYTIHLPPETTIIFLPPAAFLAFLFVRASQNIVRLSQGRKLLPIVEMELIRYNISRWVKFFGLK